MKDKWKVLSRKDGWVKSILVDRVEMSLENALRKAEEIGLDLVLVNANPPVGRLLDYSKHLYEQKKREKEIKQKKQVMKSKEVKFHVSIGEADYLHKMKQIGEFLEEGDKVDVKVVLRGREASLTSVIDAFKEKLVEDVQKVGKFVKAPSVNGKIIEMSLVKR